MGTYKIQSALSVFLGTVRRGWAATGAHCVCCFGFVLVSCWIFSLVGAALALRRVGALAAGSCSTPVPSSSCCIFALSASTGIAEEWDDCGAVCSAASRDHRVLSLVKVLLISRC